MFEANVSDTEHLNIRAHISLNGTSVIEKGDYITQQQYPDVSDALSLEVDLV